MRTHDEGGDYAPESIAEWLPHLDQLTTHIAVLQQEEVQLLERLQAKQIMACKETLSSVLAEIPAHQEDLRLLEAVGKCHIDSKR
jgi:hypothetical protein